MKGHILAFFLLVANVCSFETVFANLEPPSEFELLTLMEVFENEWKLDQTPDKIYLKPESVYVIDNKIYLLIKEIQIPLQMIAIDSYGLYTEKKGLFGWWKCTNCGYWNSGDWNTCQNCYRPR